MNALNLAKLLKMSPQNVNLLVRNGILTKGKNEAGEVDFDIVICVGQYITYLRDGGSQENNLSKTRKHQADAHLAELEVAKQQRQFCLRDEYKSNYADAIAQGATKISRSKLLSTAQKEEVLRLLRSVKLAELEDETEADDAG